MTGMTAAQLKRMARRTDPATSVNAAVSLLETLTERQQLVLRVLRKHPGGLTDRELIRQPEFRGWSDSTVRGRRAELRDMGLVEATDRRREARIVWRAKTVTEVEQQERAKEQDERQRKVQRTLY